MIRTERVEYTERKNVLPSWKCLYCGKRYETEKGFMDHKCKTKERIEELKTPIGQFAYTLYSEWMKAQKRKAPSAETFSTSKYYSVFIKFANFVQGNNLLDAPRFIKFMVDKDMSPTLWMKENIFNLYMKELDQNVDIFDLFVKSMVTLQQESEKNDVPISSILNFLGIRRIMSMIRARQISPVILLLSDQFKKMYPHIDMDDMKALTSLVNFSYWKDIVEENDNKTKELKQHAEYFGL